MPALVELYAARLVLLGTVEAGRRRLSDHLNDLTVETVVLEEAWMADLAHPEREPVRLAPASFRKSDVLLAVPLDQPGPAALRPGYVRTQTLAVAASVGPYLVRGTLHLPPGARFDAARLFSVGARTFVPLTDARVSHATKPTGEATYSALLVRSDRVEFTGLIPGEQTHQTPPLVRALQERLRPFSVGARGRADL
jgi:hypothetical protein